MSDATGALRPITPLAAPLGLLGLLPFWAPLSFRLFASGAPGLLKAGLWAQIIYGGLILSFLGGARFGQALEAVKARPTILISMAPSIFAFGVLCAPPAGPLAGLFQAPSWRGLLIAAGLTAQWLWDAASKDLPKAYRSLRSVLTVFAVAALGLGALLLH
jgi:hypothetical protein